MPNTPVISIIIVSYNNFDTSTGPCLQSLIQDKTEMEIIVVDNASDNYTCSELVKISKTDDRIRLHFNTTNRGYAGGNNDGVSMARAELLILLNNDTLIPVGAINKFVELLHSNSEWHMLGPMTNENGNEQRIFTRSTHRSAILNEGKAWCKHSYNFAFPTDELGFFCIAMKKNVYEKLSGLDESFGLGFYEDTDFCYRACKAGFNLIITEDIFIYHQGSATFAKLPNQTKNLLKVNRKLFQKKHGKKNFSNHVRYKNIQVIEKYRSQIEQGMNIEATLYKALNRMQTAEQLQPNNPLKKYRYNKKLQILKQFFKAHF